MKHLFFLLLTVAFFVSCTDSTQSSDSNSRLELVPEPDKDLREKYEKNNQNASKSCVFSFPDKTIAGIGLGNVESTLRVLGKQIKLTGDSTHLFYSSNQKQVLALTVHPGNYLNQVSIFQVYYAARPTNNFPKMEPKAFVTEKGIQLGISKENLTGKLGPCYVVKDSNAYSITLNYRIPNDLYYARYQFRKNKLERMEFGYEYP